MAFFRSHTVLLALVVLAGAGARFYGLSWGAPYKHFHIDEHFVFLGAIEMRKEFWAAALSPKFFMYSPLPMYLLIGLMEIYERIAHPFDLNLREHGVRFMVLGRAISATFGTATIVLVYAIARRVRNETAGLIAAVLAAAGVLHLRESHFFSVDVTLTFFCVLAWLLLLQVATTAATRAYVLSGVAIGLAVLCKYSAAFLIPVAGLAHLCAPGWPPRAAPLSAWARWLWKGALPGVVAVVTFFALDPLVLAHWDKFRADVHANVTGPMSGELRAIWMAQFTNVEPLSYWFTSILWWGLGPAFEIWALAGVAWLVWRRDRLAIMTAAFPIAYYVVAGQTITPYARYGVPLVPALAVVAGVFSADLIARPAWRRAGIGLTAVVVAATVLYAAAYMNVFVKPDSRLTASVWMQRRVPEGARVLVEPSHNIPPTGRYLSEPSFYTDYVLWDRYAERHDYYHLFGLDTYRYLYSPRASDGDKRAYIRERLALVDYILMDDTFVQFYAHLPASEHGVVKEYYDDLFAGRLDFELMRTFKVYPSLGGININDDGAELSYRLFDHPRIFIFGRRAAHPR